MKKRNFILLIFLLVFVFNGYSQSWNYVNSTGTSFILYGMSFPPGQSSIGYACGMQYTYNADGVIVKTTDGGDNWTEVLPVSGTIDGLQGIWFINDTVGFAGGWNNYFIKTTDGGSTWTPVTCGTSVWYYVDVVFWDSNNGVSACYPSNPLNDPAIFVTSDGGDTWTPANGVNTAEIMGVDYADQNTLFAVGTGGNVFKSTDGGYNWSIETNLGTLLFGVDFANANFGVVGGEEIMYATNDGGTTWTSYFTGYENFYGALAKDNGTGYIGGTDENIYVTTDYGATWQMEHNGGGSSSLYRIRETQSGSLFTCGSQGTIITKAPILTADFIADADTVCVGGNVNFSDVSTGNVVSWAWSFEGGTPGTSTDQNPVVTYNSSGTYDVALEISNGTITNSITKTDFITVIVTPAQANTPVGPDGGCAGVNLNYSTDPVTYATEYQWEVNPSDAGSMNGNGISATFESSSTFMGDYYIKVRAENMCGNGAWSAEFQGNLSSAPQPHQLSGDGAYCEGSQGSELILDGSESGFDYELYLDDSPTGIIEPGTGSAINFGYFTDEGTYSCIGYSGDCTEDMYGQVWVHMINTPDQAGTPEGPTSLCNDTVTIYTTSGSNDADTLVWLIDPAEAGELIPNNGEVSVEWSAEFSGLAMLSVHGENECGSGDPSEALEIEVYATPDPVISGDAMTCQYYQGIIYSTEENADNTYVWEVEGGTISSGAGTHQITVDWGAAGTGWVRVTEESPEGCINTTEDYLVTIDECVGIDETESNMLRIFPNPASEIINIEYTAIAGSDIQILLRDLTGRLILHQEAIGESKQSSIDISALKKGVYVLEVRSKDTGSQSSLIIKR